MGLAFCLLLLLAALLTFLAGRISSHEDRIGTLKHEVARLHSELRGSKRAARAARAELGLDPLNDAQLPVGSLAHLGGGGGGARRLPVMVIPPGAALYGMLALGVELVDMPCGSRTEGPAGFEHSCQLFCSAPSQTGEHAAAVNSSTHHQHAMPGSTAGMAAFVCARAVALCSTTPGCIAVALDNAGWAGQRGGRWRGVLKARAQPTPAPTPPPTPVSEAPPRCDIFTEDAQNWTLSYTRLSAATMTVMAAAGAAAAMAAHTNDVAGAGVALQPWVMPEAAAAEGGRGGSSGVRGGARAQGLESGSAVGADGRVTLHFPAGCPRPRFAPSRVLLPDGVTERWTSTSCTAATRSCGDSGVRWREPRDASASASAAAAEEVLFTPPCCRRHLNDILRVVGGFLDGRRVPHFLTAGSLLGAVRHGGLIPWDYDHDVSVSLPHLLVMLRAWGRAEWSPLLTKGHVVRIFDGIRWLPELAGGVGGAGGANSSAPVGGANACARGNCRVQVLLSATNHLAVELYAHELVDRASGADVRLGGARADELSGFAEMAGGSVAREAALRTVTLLEHYQSKGTHRLPALDFFPLRRVPFDGELFTWIPFRPEAYLALNFGPDWRTPEVLPFGSCVWPNCPQRTDGFKVKLPQQLGAN